MGLLNHIVPRGAITRLSLLLVFAHITVGVRAQDFAPDDFIPCGEVRAVMAPVNRALTRQVEQKIKRHEQIDLEAAIWGGVDFRRLRFTPNQRRAANLVEKQRLLVAAAADGDEKRVESLLSEGLSPNFSPPIHSYFPPLASAVICKQANAVRLLLHYGANPNHIFNYEIAGATYLNSSALIWAAASGQADLVNELLDRRADPNVQEMIELPGSGRQPGRNALLAANGIAVLVPLLKSGARVDVADATGDTPLIRKAREDKAEQACLLIRPGANADTTNRTGQSARSLAQEKGLNIGECMR